MAIPFYINLLLGILVLMHLNTLLGLLILIKVLGQYIAGFIYNSSNFIDYKENIYVYLIDLSKYLCVFIFKYKKEIFTIICFIYIDFNFILACLNSCICDIYMELASVNQGYLFLFGLSFCLSFMYFSFKYSLSLYYPRVYTVTNILCIIFIVFILLYNVHTLLNLIKIIHYYVSNMMGGKVTGSSAQESGGNSGGNPGKGSGGDPGKGSGGNPGKGPGEGPGGNPGEGSEKKKRKPKARWHEKYAITRNIVAEKEEKSRLKKEELKKKQEERKEERIRKNIEKKRIEDEKLTKNFSYGNVEPAKPSIPTMYDPITDTTKVIYSTDGSRAPLPDETIPGRRVVPRPSSQRASTDTSNQSGPDMAPRNSSGFRPFSPRIRNAEEQAAHEAALALLALNTSPDKEEEEDIYNA